MVVVVETVEYRHVRPAAWHLAHRSWPSHRVFKRRQLSQATRARLLLDVSAGSSPSALLVGVG